MMPTLTYRHVLRALAVVGCLTACSTRPDFTPGDECELNTECASPLVCRLGRCRIECRAPRDCTAGLECVRDEHGLGACQLPQETECTLTSDCPDFLVCRFGRCTNACEVDRDCPPGARCLSDPSGEMGCRDQADTECERNSHCPPPYICAVDERCREECRRDRDCRDGNVCIHTMEPAVCGPPEMRPDGGPVPDGGGPDADTTPLDGGGVLSPSSPTLAAGGAHTCAHTTRAGDPYCFGANDRAQIGNGEAGGNVPTPYALSISNTEVVGAGGNHTCVATSAALYCWGDNGRGQVGVGSATSYYTTPTEVTDLPAAPTDLALGTGHTCALVAGQVFCWGANDSGQLGDGTFMERNLPTEVSGLGGSPVQLTASGEHTCARLDTGRVECWGSNDEGQLGTSEAGDHPEPTPVPDIEDAIQIVAGTTHTCAIRRSGALACWGSNLKGELGRGTETLRESPAPVVGLPEPVLQVALGSTHTCARTASDVWCWGDNFFGQLGIDDAIGASFSTPRPTTLGPVEEVAAGTTHTCVRVTGMSVQCFGNDTDGQLGRGTTGGTRWMPTEVAWP